MRDQLARTVESWPGRPWISPLLHTVPCLTPVLFMLLLRIFPEVYTSSFSSSQTAFTWQSKAFKRVSCLDYWMAPYYSDKNVQKLNFKIWHRDGSQILLTLPHMYLPLSTPDSVPTVPTLFFAHCTFLCRKSSEHSMVSPSSSWPTNVKSLLKNHVQFLVFM